MYPSYEEINFETKMAGVLTVTRNKANGLLAALRSRTTPMEVYKARDHMLVYEKEADIRDMTPDFMALDNIKDVANVIVTAPGDKVDFVSRFF